MRLTDTLFNRKYILSMSRYPWIDYARGITIILVCYRHVFEGLVNVGEGANSYSFLKYINIFFFSFRMPLFFIISGLFVSFGLTRKGVKEYIIKRFSNIFYPLLIWGSLHISLQLLFSDYINAKRVPFDYINLIIHPRQIEQFWYLNALFFVGVLYALVKVRFDIKPWQQVILGLIFFWTTSYIHGRYEIGFLFDVLFFYLFFAIGDLLATFILNARNYKWLSSWKTWLIISPVFFLIQHQFTLINLQHRDDYFVQYQMPAMYVIAAIAGGAFIIVSCFLLERYKRFTFLRIIGYHSLYIYVMHLMITAFTRVFFTRILGIDKVLIIMVAALLLGIVIPIIFFNVTNRMGLWWLYTFRKKDGIPVPKNEELQLKYGLSVTATAVRKDKTMESN